jgi:uncharacterized lipoprotein YddW (UPF0748 family)
MKRITLLYIVFLLAGLFLKAQPKYEVRAVWLTTIGGIDWPRGYAHDGMGIDSQKQQLCRILDQLKAANVNTVLIQTRVRATTIYPSNIEPWDGCLSGTPGRSPGYDALQFAIDECHRRGMELHAWVVTIPVGKWRTYGCQQLKRRYPSLVMKIGEEGYMNPELPGTADYIATMCEEITRRYDIDGIHLDYIRYPETWKGKKNKEYITNIVRRINEKVKLYKPWVKLSCSPIGKYDDLSRYSSRGWNANRQVAQDAQGWLRQGLMDQLYPMMYFQGNNFYPFAINWQEYSYGRTIASGLGIYMLHPQERNWPLDEVKRQLNVTRQIGMGHCYFRAKFLLDNVKGVYDFVKDFDRQPSLVPPMTWAGKQAPMAPTTLQVEHTVKGDNISWNNGQDRSGSNYLIYRVYASHQWPVDINDAAHLVATRLTRNSVAVPYAAKMSQPLYYAVTAVDRYGNESEAMQENGPKPRPVINHSALIANDGRTLKLPVQADAEFLVVCTLQGNIIATFPNRQQVNIASLPNGIYELKSLGRKGVTHRLGFFMIRR